MPSTDDRSSHSRRKLLAICGSCVGIGSLGGYAYGSGLLLDNDCHSSPLDTSPADWPLPNYNGANTRTVSYENAPKSELSERWRVSIQHPSQPIVLNNSVFLSPEPPLDYINSYDLFSGEEQWTKSVSTSGELPTLIAGGNSLFLREINEDGDRVSKAVATADGSEQWVSDVSSDNVTPVLEEGLLIFQASPRFGQALTAIDARTGNECWQKSFIDNSRLSTIYAGNTIVLETSLDGEITALDAETGEQQWVADISEYFHPNDDHISDAIRSRLVAGTDRIFFRTYGGILIALDASTGETDWVTPETPPELPTEGGGYYIPPGLEPVAFTGEVLVAIESDTTDRSDSLHAIDPTTGSEQWAFQPEAQEGVEIRSAAVAGKTVFIVMNKELRLIDLTNGGVIESHDLGSYAESVILADSVCLVATTEEIVAFEESQ